MMNRKKSELVFKDRERGESRRRKDSEFGLC